MTESPEIVETDEELIGRVLHPRKRQFLKAITVTPNVVRAAIVSGVDRDNHYIWMRKDADYKAAFAVAWQRGIDSLESEVMRRAHEGIAKPVFRNGKRALDFVLDDDGNPVIGPDGKPKAVPAVIREFSDTLAMFILNGQRSKMYKRGLLDGATGDGVNVNINQTNVTATNVQINGEKPALADLSIDQLQKLMELTLACQAAGIPVEVPDSMIPKQIESPPADGTLQS